MRSANRNGLWLGMVAGASVASGVAVLMGQGVADQPAGPSTTYQPPSNPNRQDSTARAASEYFVTGDGNRAHLWARDGSSLRWISSSDASNRMPGEPARTPDSKNPNKPGDPYAPASNPNPK